MLAFLGELVAHSEWANAVFFHTWGKSPARDNEEMRRRVGHIIGVQHGFLAVFRGETPGGPPNGPPPSHDELKHWAQSSHRDLDGYVAALSPADLDRKVRIPWFPDPHCILTIAEALVQIAMHTQHHRGQLMTRLKDFGGEPKNVDWIVWLWKGKPEGKWS